MRVSAVNISPLKNNQIQRFAQISFQNNKVENENAPNSPAKSHIGKFLLRIEAGLLTNEAKKAYEESTQIRQDGYNIQKIADSIQEDTKEIIKTSRQILKEAQSTFRQARADNFATKKDPESGEIIQEFYDGAKGQFIMTEYDQKGNELRKIIVSKDVISVILEGSERKASRMFVYDAHSGDLINYSQGIKYLASGYRAEKQYRFEDGALVEYDIDYEENQGKDEKSKTHFVFENSKLKKCKEGRKIRGREELCEEEYIFKGPILSRVLMNSVHSSGKTEAQEEYIFSQDECLACHLKNSKKSKGSVEADKMFVFNSRGTDKFYIKAKLDLKNPKTVSKRVYLSKDDQVQGCLLSYSITGGIANFTRVDLRK